MADESACASDEQGCGVHFFAADGHLRTLEDIEADVICLAVSRYGGRVSEVARRLRIGRTTLYRKLGELGFEATGPSGSPSAEAQKHYPIGGRSTRFSEGHGNGLHAIPS